MIAQGHMYRADEVDGTEAVEHWDKAAAEFAAFLADGEGHFGRDVAD